MTDRPHDRAKRRLERLSRGAALFITATAGPPNAGCDIIPPPPDCADVPSVSGWMWASAQRNVVTPDAGTPDAGTADAGSPDAGTADAGSPDAGTPDAGADDAGGLDGRVTLSVLLGEAASGVQVLPGLTVTGAAIEDIAFDGGVPSRPATRNVVVLLNPDIGATEIVVLMGATCDGRVQPVELRINVADLDDGFLHQVSAEEASE